MVKFTISLTDKEHAFAKALVDTGRFASVSAVIHQGIEDLRRRLDVDALKHRALCEILSRRRAGEFVGAVEMDERLRRMLAGKRPGIGSDPNP